MVPMDSEIVTPLDPVPGGYPARLMLHGRTLVDTSNWSAKVLPINPGSDVVVLPPFSCVGNVVQVSVVTIAQKMSIRLESTQHGRLPPHLEDIVVGSHPSLEERRGVRHSLTFSIRTIMSSRRRRIR